AFLVSYTFHTTLILLSQYHTLSLHDALPILTAEDFEWLALQASGEVSKARCLPLTKASSMEAQKQEPGWITIIIVPQGEEDQPLDRKSTRLNSSHGSISYAVFCLKKKN